MRISNSSDYEVEQEAAAQPKPKSAFGNMPGGVVNSGLFTGATKSALGQPEKGGEQLASPPELGAPDPGVNQAMPMRNDMGLMNALMSRAGGVGSLRDPNPQALTQEIPNLIQSNVQPTELSPQLGRSMMTSGNILSGLMGRFGRPTQQLPVTADTPLDLRL